MSKPWLIAEPARIRRATRPEPRQIGAKHSPPDRIPCRCRSRRPDPDRRSRDAQHRPEDLLAGDGRIVHVGEHRRLDVVASVWTLRPAGSPATSVAPLVDAPSAANPGSCRTAPWTPPPRSPSSAGSPTVTRAATSRARSRSPHPSRWRNEHARRRITARPLFTIITDVPATTLLAEILVIEHDVGALAAEFHRDADRRGRVTGHLDTRAGRPGERHHVDVGVGGQRATPTPGPSPYTRL